MRGLKTFDRIIVIVPFLLVLAFCAAVHLISLLAS